MDSVAGVKKFITFGLISIPIRMFPAARGERVSFNQIHKPCGSRIRQQITCPTCNKTVERNELAKGYEYEKDRYVLIEEAELEKIAPQSAQNMEILEFVKMEEVSPLFFDTSYYTTPEPPGKKPYRLLFETMKSAGYAAVAKLSMSQREHIVIIHPHGKGLALHTMYYADEVREVAEYGQHDDVEVRPQEVALAKQLVESLAAPFEPGKYSDEYRARVQELIEAKQRGEEVAETPAPKLAPVIDLMEALQRSLAASGKKPPARAVETVAEAPEGETGAPGRKKAAGRKG